MNNTLLAVCFFWLLLVGSTIGCKKQGPEAMDPGQPSLQSFGFSSLKNPKLFYDIPGEISGDTVYLRYFAGFDPSDLIADFTTDSTSTLWKDDQLQQSGVTANDFKELVTYTVKNARHSQAYILKFEDLGVPAVYINTGGAAITSKEDYVAGTFQIYSGVPGRLLHEGSLRIRGRGNSTWGMDKKPYKIKLDESAALLGMPDNKDWALMANYADRSLLRNELGFEVSRRFGLAYTPRQRYVDFFLNDRYDGSYNLTEHQETGTDKINIAEEDGGYYLEVDGYAGSEPVHFFTDHGVPVTVKFPDEEDITSEQTQFIADYFQDFENRLFASDFEDPLNGYRSILDTASFIDYYLANELSGNPDMLWSMKMYKKSAADPKLYTGPVWDFDLAVNNDNRLGDASQTLMLDKAHFVRAWIDRLRQDPDLMLAIRERSNQVKASLQTLPDYVDSLAYQLRYTQRPNFIRWDILNLQHLHLSWFTGASYEDYVYFVATYYRRRLDWLDQKINSASFIPAG